MQAQVLCVGACTVMHAEALSKTTTASYLQLVELTTPAQRLSGHGAPSDATTCCTHSKLRQGESRCNPVTVVLRPFEA
jgi:hypothetical protein